MDNLITGLAGIVVLALPFAVWLRFKVRGHREQELEEIKALAAKRSQWLDELHSRFDALDKRESQRESVASQEAALRTLRLLRWFAAYQAASRRDVALERYLTTLKTLEPGVIGPTTLYLHCGKMNRRYFEEAVITPEWLEDSEPHELAACEDLRWEGIGRRRSRGLLRGPVLQPS